MKYSLQLAKHFREVHYGGNWTSVNLKGVLEGVTWQHASTKVDSLNTIVALVFHINYYVLAITKVLQGGVLDSKDKFSFDHPPIQEEKDWTDFVEKTWRDADLLASLIEQLPEDKLGEDFVDGKYGTYYRNIQGLIEHTHYHLGQLTLIKKLLS